VTRYLNCPVDARAVDAFFGIVVGHWAERGFGVYALEPREPGLEGRFVGFAGAAFPTFLPEVAHRSELGWRLEPAFWWRGLATEGAVRARDDAFARLGLSELISIIHPYNERSRCLATKLGMSVERQIHNPRLDREVELWTVGSQ